MKIVIIGAGLAGVTLARLIMPQTSGKLVQVTIIEQNDYVGWQSNAPFIYFKISKSNIQQCFMQSIKQLKQNGIQLFLRTKVTFIDKHAQIIHCQSYDQIIKKIPYDYLFLTVGQNVKNMIVNNHMNIRNLIDMIELKNILYNQRKYMDTQSTMTIRCASMSLKQSVDAQALGKRPQSFTCRPQDQSSSSSISNNSVQSLQTISSFGDLNKEPTPPTSSNFPDQDNDAAVAQMIDSSVNMPTRESFSFQALSRSGIEISHQVRIAIHGLTVQSLQLAQVIQQYYNNVKILIYQFSIEPKPLLFSIIPYQMVIGFSNNIKVDLKVPSMKSISDYDVLVDGQSYYGTCVFPELNEEFEEQRNSKIFKLQKITFVGQSIQKQIGFSYLEEKQLYINFYGWKQQSALFLESLQTSLMLFKTDVFKQFDKPQYIIKNFQFGDIYYSMLLDDQCSNSIILYANKETLLEAQKNKNIQNKDKPSENNHNFYNEKNTILPPNLNVPNQQNSSKIKSKNILYESSDSILAGCTNNTTENQYYDIEDYMVTVIQQEKYYNFKEYLTNMSPINSVDDFNTPYQVQQQAPQKNIENSEIDLDKNVNMDKFLDYLSNNAALQKTLLGNYMNICMIVNKITTQIEGFVCIARYDTSQQIKVGVPIIHNKLSVKDLALQELSLHNQKTQKELNLYNKLALKYLGLHYSSERHEE